MLSQSYSLPAFELPQPRWARGLLLALAAHAALVLLFYWPQTALEPVVLPPPAVMMSWAAQIEAPESAAAAGRAAGGIRRGAACGAAATAGSAQAGARRESENRDGAEEARQTPPSAKIAAEAAGTGQRDAQCRRVQRRRAAGADALPSDHRTDQQRRQQQRAGQTVVGEPGERQTEPHQGLPFDARSRRRSGMPQVSFSVDAQGRVSNVMLQVRSGTASLDREAVAVVSRAQPPPPPPPEMLQQGPSR